MTRRRGSVPDVSGKTKGAGSSKAVGKPTSLRATKARAKGEASDASRGPVTPPRALRTAWGALAAAHDNLNGIAGEPGDVADAQTILALLAAAFGGNAAAAKLRRQFAKTIRAKLARPGDAHGEKFTLPFGAHLEPRTATSVHAELVIASVSELNGRPIGDVDVPTAASFILSILHAMASPISEWLRRRWDSPARREADEAEACARIGELAKFDAEQAVKAALRVVKFPDAKNVRSKRDPRAKKRGAAAKRA